MKNSGLVLLGNSIGLPIMQADAMRSNKSRTNGGFLKAAVHKEVTREGPLPAYSVEKTRKFECAGWQANLFEPRRYAVFLMEP